MTNFITHNLASNELYCKGCYERVEIPRRVPFELRRKGWHSIQEFQLAYKQEFAEKHIDQGCDEASQVVAAVRYKLHSETSLARAMRVLG
jgi:hypothetical protein